MFSIAQHGGNWNEEIQSLAFELREMFFQLILTFEKDEIKDIEEIMEKILEFNVKTRHHAIWKQGNLKKSMKRNIPSEAK